MSLQASGSGIPLLAPPPMPERSRPRTSSGAREGSSAQQASSSLAPQHKEDRLMGQVVLCADTFRGGLRIASAPSGSLSFIHDDFNNPTDIVLSPYPKTTLQRRAHIRRPRSMSSPDTSAASNSRRAEFVSKPPRPMKPRLSRIVTQGLPSQPATRQAKTQHQVRPASIPPTLQNASVGSVPRVGVSVLVPNPNPQPASMPRNMNATRPPNCGSNPMKYGSILASLLPGPNHPARPGPLSMPSSSPPRPSSVRPPLATVPHPRNQSRPLPSANGANFASTSGPPISTPTSRIDPLPTPASSVPASSSDSSIPPTLTVVPRSRASSMETKWSQDSAPPTGAPPTRQQSLAASYHYKVTTDEQRELDMIAAWSKLDALLHNKSVDGTAAEEKRLTLPLTPLSMYDEEPHQLKRADTATVKLMLIERWNRASRPVVVM